MYTIEAPTGLTGRVRKMNLEDESLIQDSRGSSDLFIRLLERVWLQTDNYGPYSDPLDWRKVIASDKTYILCMWSAYSMNGQYEVLATCTGPKQHPFREIIDFRELPGVYDASPECIKAIKEESSYAIDGIEGLTQPVLVRPLNHHDEEILLKLHKSQKPLQSIIERNLRIVSIEGITDSAEKLEYLRKVPKAIIDDIEYAIEEHEGGLDMTVTIACPECGMPQEMDIPFSSAIFRRPRRSPGTRKRQRGKK